MSQIREDFLFHPSVFVPASKHARHLPILVNFLVRYEAMCVPLPDYELSAHH